ncbi:MAG: ABC transporter permease [Bifidobacteriaceae bacterium]|jgi:peptide/nickel transport system permease protein|nr:ABC transporter permease [Bifidobacteriaceae bacterium]
MVLYALRRVALFVLGLAVTTVLVFVVLRVLPGDAAQVMAGLKGSPERVAQLRAEYGMDRPLVAQYWDWISGLLKGELGNSLVTGVPISGQIASKLAVTLPLAGISLLVAVAIGLPAGIVAALRFERRSGQALSALAQAAAAVPVVWAGLMLIALLGKGVGLWPLAPSQGFPLEGWSEPGRALAALVLPALAVGIVEGAVILRFVRSALLDATSQDHVRTGAALGLTKSAALVKRGLPGASAAILSVIGLQAAGLVVGVVIVEALFALPGLGSMLVTDVGNRDLVKVQSTMVVLVGLVLCLGLVVDLATRLVDPRQRRAVA